MQITAIHNVYFVTYETDHGEHSLPITATSPEAAIARIAIGRECQNPRNFTCFQVFIDNTEGHNPNMTFVARPSDLDI